VEQGDERVDGAMIIAEGFRARADLQHKAVAHAAADAGLDLPLLDVIERRMRAAIEAGHGDHDVAAAIEAGRSGPRATPTAALI
jgi:3-hydroxyisobutyrate dehydrogenase-like beta-hydroxyacid dehydrogenase